MVKRFLIFRLGTRFEKKSVRILVFCLILKIEPKNSAMSICQQAVSHKQRLKFSQMRNYLCKKNTLHFCSEPSVFKVRIELNLFFLFKLRLIS